jgi:hypothetical protein
MIMTQQVKMIGTNGQLSLGKEFAGKMVLIDQIDNGTWIIKSGEFVPDSEKWLHNHDNSKKIDEAVDWALKNKPSENFSEDIQRIENGLHKD